MKRIMIYKRNASGFSIKRTSDIQKISIYSLLFSSFLCGMILTCAIFQTSAFMKSLSGSFIVFQDGQAKRHFILELLFTAVLFVMFIFLAYSPFGVVPLVFMPSVIGMKYAFFACSAMNSASMQGFGFYALTRIPSGILFCAGCFHLLYNGICISKKMSVCVFKCGNMDFSVREMLQMNGLPAGIMIISIILETLTLQLFQ